MSPRHNNTITPMDHVEAHVYAAAGLVRGVYEEYVKPVARDYAPVIGCVALGIGLGIAIDYLDRNYSINIEKN